MSYEDRDWHKAGGGGGGGWGGGGGFGRSSFFDNPFGWSLRAGRLLDITIKVHLFFLLFIGFELIRGMNHFGLTLRWLAVLFGTVLLHEFGHCLACRRVGGMANEILMWPLGGLAYTAPPNNPRGHLITTIGGPAVNALIILALAIVFIVVGMPVPWNPFAPFSGFSLQQATAFQNSAIIQFFYEVYMVSFGLLLFNLLPIYPLDGGRILMETLWFRMGKHRASMLATQTGMVGAVLLGLWGLSGSGGPFMIGIAIFGFLTCYQQRQMLRAGGGMMADEPEPWARGYDFNKGYGGMPSGESSPKKKSGWLNWGGGGEGSWEKKQKKIREEEAEVDRILAKVSADGLQSLSNKEKRILQRATERQRERDDQLGRVDRL